MDYLSLSLRRQFVAILRLSTILLSNVEMASTSLEWVGQGIGAKGTAGERMERWGEARCHKMERHWPIKATCVSSLNRLPHSWWVLRKMLESEEVSLFKYVKQMDIIVHCLLEHVDTNLRFEKGNWQEMYLWKLGAQAGPTKCLWTQLVVEYKSFAFRTMRPR